LKSILSILIIFLFGLGLQAQHNKEFIYGTVYTEGGEEYTGFMRWGKEEIFWHDIFNSEKVGNKYIKSPEKAKKSRWSDFDWSFSSLWEDKYKTSTHLFSCFFGDIKTLDIHSNSKVKLVFKNDAELELRGGSNDVGTTIYMYDYELGKIKLSWNKIERIDFFEAPADIKFPYGTPLYGTVSTRRNSFRGHIKWDLDERLTTDIMDGESRHGDQEIPFENIRNIEKLDDGVNLTFKSGRTMEIDGTNDCDSGNRGIAVFIEGVGSVEVPWKYFTEVEFEDSPIADALGYNDYTTPFGLDAEVHTFDGKVHSGPIVFDIDEMWEPEMLDGDDDHLEYQIPFRNIQSILPKNRSYSLINLRNGEQLLLGEGQDVSRNNDGVIIFIKSQKDPILIDWDDIDEIILK